jgi:cytochrome P450
VLTQDDTYEGFLIPKGTMLFANAWAIHRDEDEYERPDDFIPERFLDNKFGTRSKANLVAFGAGRRVCVGQHLAENSLVSAPS